MHMHSVTSIVSPFNEFNKYCSEVHRQSVNTVISSNHNMLELKSLNDCTDYGLEQHGWDLQDSP